MAAIGTNNNTRERAVDDLGIVTVRGGQVVGESFFSSIFNAFYNIVYHPIALIFAVLAILIILAETDNKHGPIEVLIDLFTRVKDENPNVFVQRFVPFVIKLLAVVKDYKLVLAYSMLVLVPYIAKPSARNLVLTAIMLAFVLLHTFSHLDIIFMTVLFYLFNMLRAPAHKFIIVLIFVLVFCLGLIDIDKVLNPSGSNSTNTTPPPVVRSTRKA